MVLHAEYRVLSLQRRTTLPASSPMMVSVVEEVVDDVEVDVEEVEDVE